MGEPRDRSAQVPEGSEDVLDAVHGLALARHRGEKRRSTVMRERVRANIMRTRRALWP